MSIFTERRDRIMNRHRELIARVNERDPCWDNGWFERWKNPVLTGDHAPPAWRYDFNPETNPYFNERLGINAAFNPGAIELNGRILLELIRANRRHI